MGEDRIDRMLCEAESLACKILHSLTENEAANLVQTCLCNCPQVLGE